MSKFFTVDRGGILREELVVTLTKYNDIEPISLQAINDEWFPDGVSRHGDKYFLLNGARVGVASPQIELIFELIRRLEYPEKKSRFQASLFATDTLEKAQAFESFHPSRDRLKDVRFWEVECDDFIKADMNLLMVSETNLMTVDFARKYWSGSTLNNNPFWEYLLFQPVKVLRRVG